MTPLFETANILIIDDTPSNLRVVVNMCEEKGYRVAIAQDGDEGLQRAQFVRPDLILLDVMMPGMDGFETCKQLKASPGTRDTPVIFMTALASTEHKIKGFQAGAVDYVTKPLQIDEVMARVDTHLQLHAAQKRMAEHNEELERRVAERTAELAAREREFRTLAENIPDHIIRYDARARKIYVNTATARLMGVKPEALLNQRPEKTRGNIRTLKIDEYARRLQGVLESGEPQEMEMPLHHAEHGMQVHNVRFVAERDEQDNIVGALMVGRDITAMKTIESELMEREQRYREIFENAVESMYLLEVTDDGRFRNIDINPALAASTGMQREAMIGQFVDDTVPEEVGRQIVEKYRRCVAAGETITESIELDLPAGKRHYISTITPITYQGRIHRLIGISRDISELKMVEHELEDSRAQLRGLTARREAVREEERKYIAREVHDELGQILTGLKMNVSLLEHRFAGSSPELRDCLKVTAQLTDRSLEVARNVASALRPASLDMGIASALEWLADKFSGNTGIECSMDIDEGEFDMAESSAIALFRIAQESLTNIARHAQATHIDIALCRGQDDYVLKVRDNGTGFDVNRKKTDSFGVVGMRERALMLGGELVMESQPGAGTQVKVRIPRKEIEGEI